MLFTINLLQKLLSFVEHSASIILIVGLVSICMDLWFKYVY